MMKQAMETIALFTKHDGDPQETLFNLQCNWYFAHLSHKLVMLPYMVVYDSSPAD